MSTKITLPILRVMVIVCVAVTLFASVMTPQWLRKYGYESEYAYPLWMVALAFLVAVGQLWGILARVAAGEPFSRRNVAYLRRISWCCFFVALAALLMLPIYFSMIKVLMAALAVAGGLVIRVLAQVFLMAARQKEEMDLII